MAGNRIAAAIETSPQPNPQATSVPPPPGHAGVKTLAPKLQAVHFAGTLEARTYDSKAPADATDTQAQPVDTKLGPPALKLPPDHRKASSSAPMDQRHIHQTLRMDFLQANSAGEALRKWGQTMQYLREVETTLIIHHSTDPKLHILPHQLIPTAALAASYTAMTERPNLRRTHTKFACVSTVTSTRTIEELKRRDPLFIQTLNNLKVFIRETTLTTADTVEVGFFVGLHPSLTNLQWRTDQISKVINTTGHVIPLHLYPRKLQETTTATSAIVLRVPKTDAREVVTRLAHLPAGTLGKQVEFFPYSLIRHTLNNSFRPLFSVQNQYIAEVGATAIWGLPMAVMETPHGNKSPKPFHQWLLESKYVQSVEPSNLSGEDKWWILTNTNTQTQLNKHLTTTVKDIMLKIHPARLMRRSRMLLNCGWRGSALRRSASPG